MQVMCKLCVVHPFGIPKLAVGSGLVLRLLRNDREMTRDWGLEKALEEREQSPGKSRKQIFAAEAVNVLCLDGGVLIQIEKLAGFLAITENVNYKCVRYGVDRR